MTPSRRVDAEETQPLTGEKSGLAFDDGGRDSMSSATTSLAESFILDQLAEASKPQGQQYTDARSENTDGRDGFEEEAAYYLQRPADRKFKRVLWLVGVLCFVGWGLAAALFIIRGDYKHSSTKVHDPAATASRGSGAKVTLDQVLRGAWRPRRHEISWISGPQGEDGLLLERDSKKKGGYLVVEDVRERDAGTSSSARVLMVESGFNVGSRYIIPNKVWPSPDLRKVLVLSDIQSNWRHSFTGKYWIFDVATQTAEPLDGAHVDDRVQLASWSPQSDAIVFTRHNNMYLRKLDSQATVLQITKDGGSELFYGVPDWVYEEEVFSGNSATWWSEDGKYIAFLRTNESEVPTYPVQYFVSRPSGKQPKPGEENYPEVRDIKYPKAGASNPVVNLQFYDVAKEEVFSLDIKDDFADPDRLITEVVWADRKVLIRETNRVSDVLKVVLMDVERRSGRTIREDDVKALDGGWFEVSEFTTYIPADPVSGRIHAGYIDTVIYQGYDHLAYFTPLDNPNPIMLTKGDWEVVNAPSAVDLKKNQVYFVATKEGSTQRHVYRVKLDGTGLEAVTNTSKEGFYDVSFSKGANFALLTYNGPNVPWQKVLSMPGSGSDYESTVEDNQGLKSFAAKHELPIEIYSTITIDGFELNVLERRPPHFDPKKKYPVLFWMYQGPGSQSVDKRFTVDYQAFVASGLGYIVVTVDGRGTGFRGRKTRCVIRGNIGYWESTDQIAAAKIWAKKKYVDEDRMAIWGWSYGGFMTLKTLERDAGQTFKYGMAVAPVTDWRFYDSIYTERYMFTPQDNPVGYDNTSISDVESLGKNVRFLVMHGVADDNVHTQSTYTLLDKLDLAGVENYDVHIFPDSDHGIYFHNANRIVYDKLTNWLVNAFNGNWLRTDDPKPVPLIGRTVQKP